MRPHHRNLVVGVAALAAAGAGALLAGCGSDGASTTTPSTATAAVRQAGSAARCPATGTTRPTPMHVENQLNVPITVTLRIDDCNHWSGVTPAAFSPINLAPGTGAPGGATGFAMTVNPKKETWNNGFVPSFRATLASNGVTVGTVKVFYVDDHIDTALGYLRPQHSKWVAPGYEVLMPGTLGGRKVDIQTVARTMIFRYAK